jgi:hypothetical protein
MAEAIVKICSLADKEWRQLSQSAYQTVTGYSYADATDRFEAALRLAIEEAQPQQVVQAG